MIACREDTVIHHLHLATHAASPVTLELNQITLSTEQHLHALRTLCFHACAHVTLSNGKIRLSGAQGALCIGCTRLTLSRMEVVRILPGPQRPSRSKEMHAQLGGSGGPPPGGTDYGMLVVAAVEPGASACVTLDRCTLRMEGDPRMETPGAVVVMGAGVRVCMDQCTLNNVHPTMTVLKGARMELHDCHANMVFGTQPVVVSGPGSKLAMTGCTLVEEEGPHLPAASTLPLSDDLRSVVAEDGAIITLQHTKVCMPLAGQLSLVDYPFYCSGQLSATDSEFDSTFVALVNSTPGCHFIRCNFNCHAASHRPRATKPLALLHCQNISDVLLEDCVFADAPYRAAIQCAGLPEPLPPAGGPPLIRIMGAKVFNCLYGIEVYDKGAAGAPNDRLTVEVEDSTIKVVQSPFVHAGERQVGLGFSGAIVSATVRRCTVKTKGSGCDEDLRSVYAGFGAHLSMEDCTVENEGTSIAVTLGESDHRAPAVFKRTTISSFTPREMVSLVDGIIPVVHLCNGKAKLIDCKIDGDEQHSAITVRGSGEVELERCEVALARPCRMPWAAVDSGAVISLKDCVVGTCIHYPDIEYGARCTLDNTIYPPWTDELKYTNDTLPGIRNIITAKRRPDGKVAVLLEPKAASSSVQQGAQAGSSAGGQGTSSARAGHAAQGVSSAAATAEGESCEAPQSCAYCHAYSPDLLACGACGVALYCDRACQKKHWKQGHKQACRQG